MTNWKTFEIYQVSVDHNKPNEPSCVMIQFEHREYGNRLMDILWCEYCYPFKTFKKGDYMEIDWDKYKRENYGSQKWIDDTGVVRKVGSSSEIVSRSSNNIPSISRNESRGIISVLNEAIDSDARNEYEAKIHVDPNSGKYSGFSLIGRRK